MHKLFFVILLLLGGVEMQASLSNQELPIPKTERKFTNIFFEDIENQLLYIDFDAVSDQLISIKLTKKKRLILEEDVSDLPINSIYELELGALKKGKYILALTTSDNIQIQKKIVIP